MPALQIIWHILMLMCVHIFDHAYSLFILISLIISVLALFIRLCMGMGILPMCTEYAHTLCGCVGVWVCVCV